jgi:hypothetical protein
MNPMLLQTPKGMIESGVPNKIDIGMIPAMSELSLPPVGDNYNEIRSMPVTEVSNPMFMPETPAPQMPQMGDIAAMFQQQDPSLQLANSLGITDPQRQAGFSQFISGLKGIEDSYNRANLPASIYLKMKEQEDLLNLAIAENRAMTAEEQTKFDGLETEITNLKKTIESQEKLSAREKELEKPVNTPVPAEPKSNQPLREFKNFADQLKSVKKFVFSKNTNYLANGKASLIPELVIPPCSMERI